MAFFKDFRDFILKGNAVSLAIAIVIGASFNNVVNSLVQDILMPPLGYVIDRVDFTNLVLNLPNFNSNEPVVIRYGKFLTTLVDFFIVGLAIFIAIKIVTRMMHKKQAEKPTIRCPDCAMEIPSIAKKCGYCAKSLG